ncbi:5'-methylthioadenosine/adenosylhomocysteine nucleosidase [Fuchsiella alkaliacetigena]|uniref:5'-methylthioadenosine/adenosylhomocysteine nucleosidase n=1 Tax=Fuchsiella alkaliacetigena TaxID=957042 RepID=UPI00200B837A|nr:5'-methylthioadenosine/adenosylhomocysteine nucleosidase [Fuchsiella alkaliacetigena]MCK8823705.1 5'-methylthioadenosine/adenosylhomocysteine nucleosidase [Fuchsiella alkaliacetigena]
MKIGIIGAMEAEIELLKVDLELAEVLEKAGMKFYTGTLQNKEVVLVKSGIGKVNAALCAQILIDHFQVARVIFTGVAGAVDAQLEVGDIVISADAVQHDLDATAIGHELGEVPNLDKTVFKADDELIAAAKTASEKLAKEDGLKVITGRVLSGDQFIAEREKVEWLRETFAGHCAEMEGAAVGQTCFLNETPFVIIRSMSDKADGGAEVDYPTFMKQVAKHSAQIVKEMLGQHL